MTSFVTQCPKCQTSFRVNPAQLSAARGMVRCGACLEVFNAGRFLQADPVRPRPGAAPAAPTAQPQASPQVVARRLSDDELLIHDDMDLEDLDLDEELARLEREELEFLAEAERLQQRRESIRTAGPPSASVTGDQNDLFDAQPLRLTPVSEATSLPPAPLTVPERTPLEPAGDLDPPLGVDEPVAAPNTKRREPDLLDEPLFELDEEPLQLNWQPPPKRWGRRLGWLLLNALALLALGAQYVTYHFEELARQDEYRPWFERVCPTLGCSLPSKVDIAQIRSSNLTVRSHPDFAGALVVDAILYNRAPFSQPFPMLELRFADLSGKLIASRRFKPSEYLAGELAGSQEMPPQTPIHIALDILDPGERAVNYSLSFHSPE